MMVVVAQLVRAPGCGPGGRGFESLLPPHFFCQNFGKKNNEAARLHFTARSATSLKTEGFLYIFTYSQEALLVKTFTLFTCEDAHFIRL